MFLDRFASLIPNIPGLTFSTAASISHILFCNSALPRFQCAILIPLLALFPFFIFISLFLLQCGSPGQVNGGRGQVSLGFLKQISWLPGDWISGPTFSLINGPAGRPQCAGVAQCFRRISPFGCPPAGTGIWGWQKCILLPGGWIIGLKCSLIVGPAGRPQYAGVAQCIRRSSPFGWLAKSSPSCLREKMMERAPEHSLQGRLAPESLILLSKSSPTRLASGGGGSASMVKSAPEHSLQRRLAPESLFTLVFVLAARCPCGVGCSLAGGSGCCCCSKCTWLLGGWIIGLTHSLKIGPAGRPQCAGVAQCFWRKYSVSCPRAGRLCCSGSV